MEYKWQSWFLLSIPFHLRLLNNRKALKGNDHIMHNIKCLNDTMYFQYHSMQQSTEIWAQLFKASLA